jgi:small conductance mechanosensitive channel
MDEAGIEIPVPQMRVYTSSKDNEGQPLPADEVPVHVQTPEHGPLPHGGAGGARSAGSPSLAVAARDVSHEPRPAPPSTGPAPVAPQIPTAGEAGKS